MEKITHLILSGGGTQGVVFVGCLKYIYSNNINITHISSCSIGSFIALMISLKLTLEEIDIIVRKTLLYDKACFIPKKDCWNILTSLGLTKVDYVLEPLKELLQKKYSNEINIDEITFADIKNNYGINLYISTTNISKSCNEIFSYENSPTTNVLSVCIASMSLPILYEPCVINDNYYYDGGLTNNFPISIFEDVPEENKLGLALNSENECQEIKDTILSKDAKLYDIMIKLIITMGGVIRNETILRHLTNDFVIVYDDIPKNWIQMKLIKSGIQVFNITNDDIDIMIEYGYNKTKEYLLKREEEYRNFIVYSPI